MLLSLLVAGPAAPASAGATARHSGEAAPHTRLRSRVQVFDREFVPVPAHIDHALSQYDEWARAASAEQASLEHARGRAARRFLRVVDAAKDDTLEGKLRAINVHVNETLRYGTDEALNGVPDFWATPLATLRKGGDCEDFSLLKETGLAMAGVDPGAMRLVIGTLERGGTSVGHAVLAVDLGEGQTAWLDNLSESLALPPGFTPIYAVNARGSWIYGTRHAARRFESAAAAGF